MYTGWHQHHIAGTPAWIASSYMDTLALALGAKNPIYTKRPLLTGRVFWSAQHQMYAQKTSLGLAVLTNYPPTECIQSTDNVFPCLSHGNHLMNRISPALPQEVPGSWILIHTRNDWCRINTILLIYWIVCMCLLVNTLCVCYHLPGLHVT